MPTLLMMANPRRVQKGPPFLLHKYPGGIQQIFLDCVSRTHSQFASRVYGGVSPGSGKGIGSPLIIVCGSWIDGNGVMS